MLMSLYCLLSTAIQVKQDSRRFTLVCMYDRCWSCKLQWEHVLYFFTVCIWKLPLSLEKMCLNVNRALVNDSSVQRITNDVSVLTCWVTSWKSSRLWKSFKLDIYFSVVVVVYFLSIHILTLNSSDRAWDTLLNRLKANLLMLMKVISLIISFQGCSCTVLTVLWLLSQEMVMYYYRLSIMAPTLLTPMSPISIERRQQFPDNANVWYVAAVVTHLVTTCKQS